MSDNFVRFQLNYILALLALLVIHDVIFAQPIHQYKDLYDVPSEELFQIGEKWLQQGNGADSALVYFSLVASRYKPEMTETDKIIMLKANYGKWLVYFSHLFDYPKAYESIQVAIDIAAEANLDKSLTELGLGSMLHMMADQSGSKEPYRQAIQNYTSAIRNSAIHGNDHTLDLAFVNLLTASRTLGETDSLDRIYPFYAALPDNGNLPRRSFAKKLYHATANSLTSIKRLHEAEQLLPEDKEYVRLRFIGKKTFAELLADRGSFREAETAARDAVDYAQKTEMRDCEMVGHLLIAEILGKEGKTKESLDERDKYLRIKENLADAKQIHRLEELRFLSDIRKAEEQFAIIHEQRRQQTIVIILMGTAILFAILLIWVILSKNAKLRKAYDSVYRQFHANMAAEDRERELLRQLQVIPPQNSFIENLEDCKIAGKRLSSTMVSNTKYSSSKLSDEKSGQIQARIAEVAADSGIICSPDCTIGHLAEIIGCNTKYLSQIINDKYGCNFNSFINELRIKEACRRLAADDKTMLLTIEAIANEVGFKSKSSFFSSFKQVTGLTPAEFRRRQANGKRS